MEASFWGFVSNHSTDDLQGPFDEGREDQLDPVNIIFYTDDGSSALYMMVAALEAAGWTSENPCLVETNLYAYFEGIDVGIRHAASFFEPIDQCGEKYHVRLFVPSSESTWGIAAVHHECNALDVTDLDLTDCPALALDVVIGWDDAQQRLRNDLLSVPEVQSAWQSDLGNTASAEDCPGGGWRNNGGTDVCNDGVADVFELGWWLVIPPSGGGNLGDVDGSGSVDALDALLVVQFAAGLVSSVPLTGDVNLDGAIDPLDAALILQYAAGLIGSLPP